MVAIDEFSSTGMTAQDTRSPAGDIVTGCRVLGSADHGDPVWGHVSQRDPGGRGVWLKGGGRGFYEVAENDVILIDFQGSPLTGSAVSRGERKVRRVGGVFADQAGRIR